MRIIITYTRQSLQIPVLLGTQTLFNIGFYAVVPFIALTLSGDFGLTTVATGLVLGIRTFAQQGLFVIGGTLSDRFNPRAIILTGIATRVGGFSLLAASLWQDEPDLALFICGTVLTGFGGALFSPGLNVLIAQAEARRVRGRITLFAWLSMTGEIGAAIGPVVGALLLGAGFAMVAAIGAAYFALIALLLALLLPRTTGEHAPTGGTADAAPGLRTALRDKAFVTFVALHSVDLLAYNQLYLAVPLLLTGASNTERTVALVFAWISALTLCAQLPLARWSALLGPSRALRLAYSLNAAGFVCAGLASLSVENAPVLLVFAAATFFGVGHLMGNPTALHAVPRFAPTAQNGSYFGLLATFGGIAVLLGNLLIGVAVDSVPSELTWLPWALIACLPAASAIAVPHVLRSHPRFTVLAPEKGA
jgi:MFS family permease